MNIRKRFKKYKFIKFFLFLFFAFNQVWGQSHSEISRQLRIDYNPTYYINPGLSIFGEFGIHKELEKNGLSRYVIKPSMRLFLGGRFYFTAGVGNFITVGRGFTSLWEIRPYQGISVTWPYWRIPLQHYLRLEERFIFETDNWRYSNALRLRYSLSISHRWGMIHPGQFWRVDLAAEAFITVWNTHGKLPKQGRITFGADRSFNFEQRVRIEVIWQQEQLVFDLRQTAKDLYFRLRFYQTWGNM
ncbi:MAG: DUF2490 domain-containing protein [Calditrichales bacterium]|nr:MAG: DUF2490 domain-containing protein [Calditrichales bacterium]